MKYLKYSDISLVPNYSECSSRSDADASLILFGKKFNSPIIPANMKSVIDTQIAKWMSDNNYFYIMHRFDINIFDFVKKANQENWKTISISVGAKLKDKTEVLKISQAKLRVDFITIDIAHGHSKRVKTAIQYIKKQLPDTIIVAGNVATPDAVFDLANWGAQIVKVGIGQGSPCTTKDKTGFTMPMFSCVKDCSNIFTKDEKPIPIIADGGIKNNGDIAKALVAGATLVMAGGLFAACTDSPAKWISDSTNNSKKAYFGSASFENKGHNNHIEGKLNSITSNNMNYEQKLSEIIQDLQSSISYAGGSDLSIFKNVEYIEV